MAPMPISAAVDAARQHLPAWLPWASLLAVPLAFLAAIILELFVAVIGLLPLRRLPEGAHWTERARRSFPAAELQTSVLWLTVIMAALWGWQVAAPFSVLPPKALSLLAAIAAYVGGASMMLLVFRRIRRAAVSFGTWWRRVAAGWVVFAAALPVNALVFFLISDRFDVRTATVLCVGAGALVWLWCGGALRMGLILGLVKPASPRLVAAVDSLATRISARPSGVYEVDIGQANGWAMPLAGALLVSEDALAVLDDDELAALCGHELGHLSESRGTRLARALPGLTLLSLPALQPLGHTWGWPQALLLPLVLLLGMSLLSRVWRRLEQRSDKVAVEHESEPGAFARSLEKLYEFNLAPAVVRQKRLVHPHLYDRLLAAGITPAYPRPAPPSQVVVWVALVPMLIAFAIVVIGLFVLPFPRWHTERESVVEWRLALLPRPAWDLDELARLRGARGDSASAIALARAATSLDRREMSYPAHLAMYLARARRCDEAEEALRWAMQRRGRDCGCSQDALSTTMAEMGAACWTDVAESADGEPPQAD
jgi:Zn-dependent protease with chaperone function